MKKKKLTKFDGQDVPACPKCSSPMLDDSRIFGLKCTACGHEQHYEKPILATVQKITVR